MAVKKQTYKFGDIVRNPWVDLKYSGVPNPIAFFIYFYSSGKFVYGIRIGTNHQFEKASYYKADFYADGDHRFELVGHTKVFDLLKDELMNLYEELGSDD